MKSNWYWKLTKWRTWRAVQTLIYRVYPCNKMRKLKILKLCDYQRLKCGNKDDRDYRLGLSSSRQFFVFVLFLAIYFIQNISLSKTLKDSNCLLSHIAYFRNGAFCNSQKSTRLKWWSRYRSVVIIFVFISKNQDTHRYMQGCSK